MLMLMLKVVIVVHLDIIWPQDIGLAHITYVFYPRVILVFYPFILVRVLF